MPKEHINYPEPEAIAYAITEEEFEAGKDALEILPAAPQISLHWHAEEDTPQLSFSIDADLLSRIMATRDSESPDHSFVTEEGRCVLYTAALSRADLQRMIKAARRARNAAYGSDE